MYFDDITYDTPDPSSSPLTLSQLNSLVREVIELSMPNDYWVTVELASVRDSHGHCYMELVEKDDRTNTPIAQARACCWRNTWMRLSPKFIHDTGQALHSGLKVLLRLHANFHEAYGFSWTVTDIDPSYTMGDMARRRQEILRTLKEQGVIDMNKTLHISPFALHIAVISSATAAGYGDFCRQLADNEYGFRFQTQLFPAIMQGEQVQDSIIGALEAINEQASLFDAVVIIRGGGSTADLSGFDTLPLAENVANFPLPIITGIGHDRDQSVLDIIACVSQKTPTAVAAFLIGNLADTMTMIDDCSQRITRSVSQRMQNERFAIQHLEQRITAALRLRTMQEKNRLAQCQSRFSHAVTNRLLKEQNRIDKATQRIPWLVAGTMERERHRLEMIEQRAKAVDPKNILRRGYSITIHNGSAITDSRQLAIGDDVTIMLASGTVGATVKE